MGIRQKLAEAFGSSPNKEGKLGKQHAEDIIVTSLHSENYYEDLASSVFCGVLPGDGWSGRMEDSVLHGCIPMVIQENVLNYKSFVVRIQEDEIPALIKILRGFNDTKIEFKLASVKKIWQRFVYRDSILLEAERQTNDYGRVDEWVVDFLRLTEDDVFATFVQMDKNEGSLGSFPEFYKETHYNAIKGKWATPDCERLHTELERDEEWQKSQSDVAPLTAEQMSIKHLRARSGVIKGIGIRPSSSLRTTATSLHANDEAVRHLVERAEQELQQKMEERVRGEVEEQALSSL